MHLVMKVARPSPWLTAAIPMDNRYHCSCKLTRVAGGAAAADPAGVRRDDVPRGARDALQ